MTIAIKDMRSIREFAPDEIDPIAANVKYAQRNDQDVKVSAEVE